LGRAIVLVGVAGRANLIGLLCVLLRQRAPQLRDLIVIEWLDGSAVLRVFGLNEVAAGSARMLTRTLSAEIDRPCSSSVDHSCCLKGESLISPAYLVLSIVYERYSVFAQPVPGNLSLSSQSAVR
jgi:hypothetical protein